MSERLKEIDENKIYNTCGFTGDLLSIELTNEEYSYLYAQAERVQKLGRQLEVKEGHKKTYRKAALRYKEERRQSHETLEFYADELTYTDKQRTSSGVLVNTGYLNIMTDKGQRARRELGRDEK